MPYVLQELAEWLSALSPSDLPVDVRDRAKTLIADSVACAVGGSATKIGRSFVDLGVLWGAGSAASAATVMAAGGPRASVPPSVHVNAMLANLLDFDDTSLGHPGSVVVPTALGVGEAFGASGRELLLAVVAGYDVAGRIMRAVSPSATRRTQVVGQGCVFALAAAAVAGKLRGLDASRMAHALAIAGANGPVPSVNKTVYGETGPTPVKNNMGAAAEAGVWAALMAEHGLWGPVDLLEGPTGLANMINSDRQETAEVVRGLGEHFHVSDVSLKPWPCCRFIHAPIDGVSEALREAGGGPEDITSVEIRTFTWVARPPFTVPAPRDMSEAQYSLCYCLACALLGIEPGPRWFHPETLGDAGVIDLARKVSVVPDPEADRTAYRRHAYATCFVRTRQCSARVHVRAAKGDRQAPLSADEARIKFTRLMAAGGMGDHADELHGVLGALEGADDVSTWFPRWTITERQTPNVRRRGPRMADDE